MRSGKPDPVNRGRDGGIGFHALGQKNSAGKCGSQDRTRCRCQTPGRVLDIPCSRGEAEDPFTGDDPEPGIGFRLKTLAPVDLRGEMGFVDVRAKDAAEKV